MSSNSDTGDLQESLKHGLTPIDNTENTGTRKMREQHTTISHLFRRAEPPRCAGKESFPAAPRSSGSASGAAARARSGRRRGLRAHGGRALGGSRPRGRSWAPAARSPSWPLPK
ncbi:nuclear receptor subfamily 5 group A member 2 [Homo sapiens]|uniref:Nuclear receptor subfamily 5 group A member 2 n=1 Tax=Homo sapiens TaxID=9606 RepID=E9PQH2_HUMAN|nr:nuclear receptor subfamily 5 group A member 2 [Homo sapiens]